ncbi:MAG: hypothetical protein LBQ98_05205 [Nitrososphaerota archaeon]|jgi:hypothetical protein|nr:hypothetical protein [Nitrososphaerota archaeon]
MNKRSMALYVLILLAILLFVPLKPTDAAIVFTDDFSSGNFERWSKSLMVPEASQTVRDSIARFIVPTPVAGSNSCSYLIKDGFTSTINSSIAASQDILVTKVPNGALQGNGAIFFLYVCDSTDLTGNAGNIGIGIDGSNVWSMWIGGDQIYNYVFQTEGPLPVSNTWYRIILTIDNQAQTAVLEVNGAVVINASQQQFTNRTHPISLMSGMGENWWSAGSGLQEIDVTAVQLYISDAIVVPQPSSTLVPVSTFTPSVPSLSPTQTPTVTPSVTAMPSFSLPPLHPLSTPLPGGDEFFGLVVVCVIILIALMIVLVIAVFRRKR